MSHRAQPDRSAAPAPPPSEVPGGPARPGGVEQALARAFWQALDPEAARRLGQRIDAGEPLTPADLDACPALRGLAPLTPGLWRALGRARDRPRLIDQVAGLVAADDSAAALAAIALEGGPFLAMTRGLDEAQALAAALPEPWAERHLHLALLGIVNAFKSGDLARADALLGQLARRIAIPPLETCGPGHDPALVCVLFMKAIYADEPISDAALDRLFALLSDLPAEAPMLRGLLYNVGLDILLRQHDLGAAREAARRALHHYGLADEPGLAFYVHLYQAQIALWQADLPACRAETAAARRRLSERGEPHPNDVLLLRHAELIADYESGRPEALVQALVGDEELIPFGELWPAMAEPILAYGRRALAGALGPAAALSWVRRWRVRQWRSDRFDRLISVQEALALQAVGRWQEAEEVLGHVTGDPGVEARIARLAAALDRAPASEELGRRLRDAAAAPSQTLRQRLVLVVIAAQAAAARRSDREAVRLLGGALREAGPDRLPMAWRELAPRLADLLRRPGLRGELRRQPGLRRALDAVTADSRAARPEALTAQEYRVLLLLAEGLPGKIIGQRLGISLPTVKFHVANLAAKAGSRGRKALVERAAALGWLIGQASAKTYPFSEKT